MTTPRSAPLYKLKSEDGQIFNVERGPMKFCAFINQKFIDHGVNDRNCERADPILVPFHSSIVQAVIEWLYHYQDNPLARRDSKIRYHDFSEWDKQFFNVESGVLFALLNASHALGVEDLMNMGCAAAAELIRGKSTEEIRKIYGIRSDEEQMEEALANGGEGTSAMTFTTDSD
ncbi:Skp1-related protein [Caenorhabditis elegans]|uniref:Skp1-related protein n=1 Tax=Caenorhabditis elegans TaxID=6239 RepID=G5EE98_CAEEL|nr:Skp1-related protein [Caenorhabditis elegans]AAL34107.1 SKR-20 [Caenorhabditis elegans]CAA90636.1 Skp1-related protein [Caenorhabditis elegans]|eukprot:NP_510192.1 SKp1 Related (ubiquitin ligase complex component) [Caenorhabditis elegans]